MVELNRAIPRRVVLCIKTYLDDIRSLDESVWKELPFPEPASFSDGRVGYFLLAEAGFPYLAYALFGDDKPRDEKEEALYYTRDITVDIGKVLFNLPFRFYDFTIYWPKVLEVAGNEVQRFLEWAEKLTLGDVEAMLDWLEELERQQRVEPEIYYDPDEECLKSIKNLAELMRWLLDERTRQYVTLVATVNPRLDEPGVD